MRVRISTMLAAVIHIFLGSLFLWAFQIFYIQRDWSLFFVGFDVFLIIDAVFIIAAAVILFLIMRPIDAAETLLLAGEKLSDKQAEELDRTTLLVPRILAVLNIGIFLLGPLVMDIISSGQEGIAAFNFDLYTVVSSSFSIAVYIQFLEAKRFEHLKNRLKNMRGITTIGKYRAQGWRRRQFIMGLTIIIFASGLMFAAGMGYLREELLAPAQVDATASASESVDYRYELWSQAVAGNPPQLTIVSPELHPRLAEYTLKMAILLIIIGLASLLAISFESVPMSRRLALLERSLADLANGRVDRSRKLTIISDDELEKAVHNINLFIDRQADLFDAILHSIQDARSVSSRLKDMSSKAENLGSNIGSGISDVQQQLGSQESALHAVDQLVVQLTDDISRTSDNMQTQSDAVSRSSSAVEEMIANIASVAKNAQEAFDRTTILTKRAEEGERDMAELLRGIQSIADSSNTVNQNVGEIVKIAAQTNLLAMNAAIEAAHAGDVGSGFAVVASEVRKLAENSSGTAQAMTSMIKEMNVSSIQGLQVTQKAKDSFSRISENVQANSQLISEIRQAMVEQEQGNMDVQQAMNTLIDLSRQVAELTSNQEQESVAVKNQMKELDESVGRIKAVMDGNLAMMTDVESFIGELQKIISENTNIVEALVNASSSDS